MFVVWKRPDGFHGASPSDFEVVEMGDARLWLHKSEHEQFPFRVSGGWEKGDSTKRLNKMVNSLNKGEFLSSLISEYEHTMSSEPAEFFAELEDWMSKLVENPKGDTWEVEIISKAMQHLAAKLSDAKSTFLDSTQPKE